MISCPRHAVCSSFGTVCFGHGKQGPGVRLNSPFPHFLQVLWSSSDVVPGGQASQYDYPLLLI